MTSDTQPTTAPGGAVTVSVLLLASMTIMANATIAPSLPGLKEHFAGTDNIETLLGLLITLPSAMIVLSAGIIGTLADRYDRRPMLVIFGLLFALGGSSGLWTGSLTAMLIGRAVLGLGVAGTMTLALTFGAEFWQGPARARFMGLQGASMSAGGVVVTLLGGALAAAHWRGAFAVYLLALPIAIFALVTLAPLIRRDQSMAARAAQSAQAAGDRFPWAVYAFVGSLGFGFMALFYVMPTRLPFLLQTIGAADSFTIGLTMASMTLWMLPGALLYGRIRQRLSALAVFALGFGMMAIGLAVISQAQGLGLVFLGLAIAGLGMGAMMPNFTTYFMGFVPRSLQGRGSGLLTTSFFAGQFCSPLVSAPLVAQFGLAGAFSALGGAMAVVAVGLAVAAVRTPRVAMG